MSTYLGSITLNETGVFSFRISWVKANSLYWRARTEEIVRQNLTKKARRQTRSSRSTVNSASCIKPPEDHGRRKGVERRLCLRRIVWFARGRFQSCSRCGGWDDDDVVWEVRQLFDSRGERPTPKVYTAPLCVLMTVNWFLDLVLRDAIDSVALIELKLCCSRERPWEREWRTRLRFTRILVERLAISISPSQFDPSHPSMVFPKLQSSLPFRFFMVCKWHDLYSYMINVASKIAIFQFAMQLASGVWIKVCRKLKRRS